jgi:protein-disulfide isomerase
MNTRYAGPRLSPPVQSADHVLGPRGAVVTLVEYGDYECPGSAAAHTMVQEVLSQTGDQVLFAYRHFPLAAVHTRAYAAAEAAEAAGVEDRFWEMHDILFENQDALELRDLVTYAEDLGLDVDRFKDALTSGVYAARVRNDFLSGARSGVKVTPAFFLNGDRYDGVADPASLLVAIQSLAGAQR